MTKPRWASELSRETAIYIYVDLANVFHWQDKLKWSFRVEDLMNNLKGLGNVKEIKVYYGDNPKSPRSSKMVKNRFRKAGAIYRTKEVKFITKPLDDAVSVRSETKEHFSKSATKQLNNLLKELRSLRAVVEEPKCNFDVEMALDMMDDAHKMSAVVLLSGDSDLAEPLERLKVKGKKAYVVAVRGSIAQELKNSANHYIAFGKLYNGRKRYTNVKTKRKPHNVGPRE